MVSYTRICQEFRFQFVFEDVAPRWFRETARRQAARWFRETGANWSLQQPRFIASRAPAVVEEKYVAHASPVDYRNKGFASKVRGDVPAGHGDQIECQIQALHASRPDRDKLEDLIGHIEECRSPSVEVELPSFKCGVEVEAPSLEVEVKACSSVSVKPSPVSRPVLDVSGHNVIAVCSNCSDSSHHTLVFRYKVLWTKVLWQRYCG